MSERPEAGLPEGRRGQILAAALLVILAAFLWLGVASPLISWYQGRSEALATRQALLDRMAARAGELPALRRLAAASQSEAAPPDSLLAGDSDAIAAATLQGVIETMAATSGATLASEEVLPAVQQASFRQISLRIALSGRWPVLISLLRAIDTSDLRLMVDDLEFHALADANELAPGGHAPLDMRFVVTALRPAASDSAADDLQAQANAR
jgi:hypothetical protein